MAQETAQEIREHFNSIARRYDLMNTLLSFGLHHLWKRLTVSGAGLHTGDRVLDVCGGTADLAIMASRRVGANGAVVAYDFSMQMLTAGRAKAAGATVPAGVQFVCGDAEHIAAGSSRFDVLFIGFGLRNLADMKRGLKEMYRVIKPGGKLAVVEFQKKETPFGPPLAIRVSPEELRRRVDLEPEALTAAGEHFYLQVFRK